MVDAAERIATLEAELARRDVELAGRDARIADLMALVAKLAKEVAALKSKLGENSSNSGRPPSSDPPKDRAARRREAKELRERQGTGPRRKQGAQPGHKPQQRVRLPENEVDVEDVFPESCECCGKRLPKLEDDGHVWHQVTEVPLVKPRTTEFRLHSVECNRCGESTRGVLPPGTPPGAFGPRLTAIAALLTGAHRVSRRGAQELLHELLGVRMSLGALSKCEERVSTAVEAAVDAAAAHARGAAVKNVDATTWYLRNGLCQLWVIATTLVTVFSITANGKMETVKDLLGTVCGVLVSDRARAFNFWAMKQRQVCWAHLLRKFVAFATGTGKQAVIGGRLVPRILVMFRWWKRVRDGELPREEFQQRMKRLSKKIELLLEEAAAADEYGLSGSCADILKHREALWTFVSVVGVEPTNNFAEQQLRSGVQLRRLSMGSQSERGLRFVERTLTIAKTLAAQRRHGRRTTTVLEFLTAACTSAWDGQQGPSLLPKLAVTRIAA